MDFKTDFLLDLNRMISVPRAEEYKKREKASELGIVISESLGWKESDGDPIQGIRKYTLHVIAVDAKTYYEAIERIKNFLPKGHAVFAILEDMHNTQL